MRRLVRAIALAGSGQLATLAVGTGVALASGRAAWLLLAPAWLVAALAFLVGLGLRGSHGGIRSFLRGQLPPRPRRIPRDAHLAVVDPPASAVARVNVEASRPVARVSDRFLSVAVDLSQVVGGKWWNPSADRVEFRSGSTRSPVFDFDRPRLERLTSALAPLYLRVGGSEADKVRYSLDDDPAVPAGYQSVLARTRWDSIQSFCRRTGSDLVFTLNAGPAARRPDGSWDPAGAEALMRYAAGRGHRVSVWELGNELNIVFSVHGFRHQPDPAGYALDLRVLRGLRDRLFPQSLLAGQGSAYWPVLGEPLGSFFGFTGPTLSRAAGLLDVFTWHYYPQQSRRCPMASRKAHPARLLDPANLDEAGYWAGRIGRLRDRCAPGLPVWLGETGNAQCGGEPGLSDTFLAGLWWLDELGLMARLGQQVVVRQSLTGMDYGLLDEATLAPRPDYWNSLLWRRLMGTTVYAAKAEGTEKLRVYAHCGAGGRGITLLAIHLDHRRPVRLELPQFAGRQLRVYALTAADVLGRRVLLNGRPLDLGRDGELPVLRGAEVPARPGFLLPPLSCGFFTVEDGGR